MKPGEPARLCGFWSDLIPKTALVNAANNLVPMMRVPPDLLDVELDAAAKINRGVLFVHAELLVMVELLVGRAIVANILETPLDDDQVPIDLRGRTPVPMILMAGVCVRQAVLRSEFVDRPGLAIVTGPDAGLGALVGRERVVNVGDVVNQFRPSELISDWLRQKRLVVHFGLRELDAERILISEHPFRRKEPCHQRNGRNGCEQNDYDYRGLQRGSPGCRARCEPAFDDDSSARQQHGIDRKYVIVFGVRDFHQYKKDYKREAKYAPAAVTKKPD